MNISRAHAKKLQPVLLPELAPTGTEGPKPRPAEANLAGSTVARLPYNVAFREILRFVTQGLKNAGEQWTDQAKQNAVCAILIQAEKDGYLTLWERNP